MRAETKRRIVAGGLFLLPMGLVWITGTLLGGPHTVQGGPQPAVAMPPVVPSPRAEVEPPTAAEQAAIVHAAWLRRETFGATPFYFTPREVEAPMIDLGPEAPDFVVQGILASSRGNTAIIDRSRIASATSSARPAGS